MRFTKREFWLPLMAGVLLTVFFYFVGALLSGGGHSLTAITIFFPYGLILGQWLEDTRWEFVAVAALLLQFPLYGILLAQSREGGRKVTLLILLITHSLAAAAGVGVESARQEKFYSMSEVKSGRVKSAGGAPLGTAPANNGMHPTALSLALINLAPCDAACMLSSGGG